MLCFNCIFSAKSHTCIVVFSSVQSLSRVRLFVTPMNRSTPGLPVHRQLPESTQTHVHWAGDAFQPSHPLSSPSPPASNPSQHQGLFQWANSSHEMVKVLRVSASASVLPMRGCNQFLHRFWSPRKWNITLFIFSSYICPFKCCGSVSRQKCVSGVMDKLPNF